MKNKIPDCDNCEYSAKNMGKEWYNGGHCYMFKEIMLDCAQFKPIQNYNKDKANIKTIPALLNRFHPNK